MDNTTEALNELYKVNNVACWAKERLRILSDMLDARISGEIDRPLSQEFIRDEIARIQSGIIVYRSK